MSLIVLEEQSTPSTPSTNQSKVYPKAGGLFLLDDSGTETNLASGTTRTVTIASSATPTPNVDITDIYTITALAEAATFGAPTGTPVNGQKLIIRVKDNASARALSWNVIYREGADVALPATTVLSKTLYCGFIYNSTDSKWDLLALVNNI